jgi:two-component system sensor histidine kinase BaeS
MMDPSSENPGGSLNVPWNDAVRFIRQFSHDLRNNLNAIELQSTYVGELAENPELKSEIKRLREMISGLTSTLQKLSRAVGEVEPNRIPYRASEFIDDLRKQIVHAFPDKRSEIVWNVQPGDAVLDIDPQLLQETFIELFGNAFQHDRADGELVVTGGIDKGRFILTLAEPKPRFELSTKNWGREPLRRISKGHYGFGLHRVRVIMEAHDGEMHAQYDPKTSTLVTTFVLPSS